LKVLLVAYYFKPYKGVGALRSTYWAENINELDPEIVMDVLTAQEQVTNENLPGNGKIFTVKDNKKSKLSRFIRFDSGVNWRIPLREFIKRVDTKYDTVIFSGSPFLHFFLAKEFKKKMNCRIIFDFRDPFANNPYYKNSFLKGMIRRFLERKMINLADKCITVNDFCKGLIENNEQIEIEIIENGFNEKIIDRILSETSQNEMEKYSFVYAGKLYGASPEPFLETISAPEYINKINFCYVGEDFKRVDHYNKGNFDVIEMLPYDQAVKKIAISNTGIIFTGGQSFQSTTKIFDYIGLNKNILIITEGNICSGNIHKITKDYPYVFWAENNCRSISETINETLKIKCRDSFEMREKYSRKEGLKKLINMMLK
jgi:hypothetical protein